MIEEKASYKHIVANCDVTSFDVALLREHVSWGIAKFQVFLINLKRIDRYIWAAYHVGPPFWLEIDGYSRSELRIKTNYRRWRIV